MKFLAQQAWIIEHATETDDIGLPLVWSNSEGWTDGDDFETFSDDERNQLDLPIGGKWTVIHWKVCAA